MPEAAWWWQNPDGGDTYCPAHHVEADPMAEAWYEADLARQVPWPRCAECGRHPEGRVRSAV